MITMQTLSQVVIQHLITKIFAKPGRAILTTFKGSEVTVTTSWTGDDLKIRIKKIRGQVSGEKKPKKIWTPGDPGGPKKIISAK